MHVKAGTQKTLEGTSDALELELHTGINCPLSLLGMALGFLLESCMLLPMETSLSPHLSS